MEVTFSRAFKIWWGFMWRAWILTMPLTALIAPIMFLVIPFPKPGEPPKPMDANSIPGFVGKFFLIWILMMAGMVVMQSLAMRWVLKTKWSDFKVVLVPSAEQNENLNK